VAFWDIGKCRQQQRAAALLLSHDALQDTLWEVAAAVAGIDVVAAALLRL
jgi:hypothetical protein